MLRRTLWIGVALVLLPGSAARASEEDLGFFTAISAGIFMLVGGGFCFATDAEPGEYARSGPYLGLGASYAGENFQQKGGIQLPSPPPTLQPLYNVLDRTPQLNRFFGLADGRPCPPFCPPNDGPFYSSDPTTRRALPDPDLAENLLVPLATPGYFPAAFKGEGPPSRFTGGTDPGPVNGNCGAWVPATGLPLVDNQGNPLPQTAPCVWTENTYVVQSAGGPLATRFREPQTDNFNPDGTIRRYPELNQNTANVYQIRSYGDDLTTSQIEFGGDEPGAWQVDDTDSIGLNVRAGYRCHPRAAHELHFEWLADSFDITGSTSGYITLNPNDPLNRKQFVERVRRVTSEVDLWTFGANTKLFLTKDRIQPYVLAGLGITNVDEKSIRETVLVDGQPLPGGPQFVDSNHFADFDISARIGGGIDIYATKNLVFSLEGTYVRPTGRAEPYDYYSLGAGILWRFDPFKSAE
jgi:opacity protein-like surface antigen